MTLAITTEIKLTRPLPKGFKIVAGPNGNLSIHKTGTGWFYHANAWKLIEQNHPKWRDMHNNIFGATN